MDWSAPCPICGLRIRLGTRICMTRLVARRMPMLARVQEVPRPSFDPEIQFQCPACREPLSVHADVPIAAA